MRAKKKVKKKRHAEGNSNCDSYLMCKIWQCLFKISLIQNILRFCENQELCLKHSAVLKFCVRIISLDLFLFNVH